MSRTDAHEQYAELAVGYALYALEPEEEQLFLNHLAACAACERALAEHAETLGHLAYAADLTEQPPALLEGIREGLRASSGESVHAEPVTLQAAREVRARRRLQPPGMRRAAGWVGAAAALTLIASLGVWNTALQRDNADQDALNGRFQQAVDEIRVEGARTVQLAGEGGRVVAVAVVHDHTVSLVVDGLAPNDVEATSYVLWAKSRVGSVKPVAAFDVPREGVDVLRGMALAEDGDDLTRFMVTHEDGNTPPPASTRPVLAAGDA